MNKAMMPAILIAALSTGMPSAVIGAPMADAGDDPEVMLKKVSQQLEKLDGEIKQTAEKALKQTAENGELTQELKQSADKLLTEQTALQKSVEALTAQAEGTDTKLLELSQKVAEGGGGNAAGGVMSLGRAVVAQDEQIKNYLSAGASGTLTLKVSNAITTAAGSGGGLIYNEEERDPVRLPRRRLLVRDLLMQGITGSDLIKFRKQTVRTDNTGMVAEEGTMPTSEYGWEKATSEVKKIAHVSNISEEAMADADQLQTELDSEMRYGLDLEEETQIVAGDGTGENFAGLLTEATAFAAAAGLPNANRIDRLRLALLQVTLADYMATSMLLNPTDWAAIDLLKVGVADDRYVFGNPGAQSTPMLWGKDVVETNTMSGGEWLVGDLMMAATYYDRQMTEVLISSEHDTNFIEDMLTMKARKRAALAIKRPAAMVTGNFTFA